MKWGAGRLGSGRSTLWSKMKGGCLCSAVRKSRTSWVSGDWHRRRPDAVGPAICGAECRPHMYVPHYEEWCNSVSYQLHNSVHEVHAYVYVCTIKTQTIKLYIHVCLFCVYPKLYVRRSALRMRIIRQIYIPHLYCRMREDCKTMAAVVWHHL